MTYIKALCNRIISLIHCCYLKVTHPSTFFFDIEEIIASSTHFTFNGKGSIVIGKKCGMRRNCEISVAEKGEIIIGNNCFFNKGCIIACHEKIDIGDNTRLGPNVMIFDHDYDFRNIDKEKRDEHNTSPIMIGKNVWLGAGVIVLRGTNIGDNCVVGAGNVLKGNYQPNTIIKQKREDTVTELLL